MPGCAWAGDSCEEAVREPVFHVKHFVPLTL
jgi:hypothetical protein